MKKRYIVPDIEIIEFEITDIITHSLATGTSSGDDNETEFPWGTLPNVFGG